MGYTVTQESFDTLGSYWKKTNQRLNWGSVFVLPGWLEVWWRSFQPSAELCLSAVRQDADIMGISPLQIRGNKAFFVGDTDVCDYMDFVVAKGNEREFFGVLLEDLRRKGITYLDLEHLRPDSSAVTYLPDVAKNRGYEVSCHADDVSVELDLPATWDEYLVSLSQKQRHEVKRKLRRLSRADKVDYRYVEVSQGAGNDIDTFLKLFSLSPKEKANFMTAQKESFFKSVAETMAGLGLLRYGILEMDGKPVAMTINFDYNEAVYLYNSSYDPEYRHLSVGVLSKVLCIKESIKRGKKRFDFLKGDEAYKCRLGGRKRPLYRCQITVK